MSVSHSIEMTPLENLDSLMELLRAEGLPHVDLGEPEREFWQLQKGGCVVGYVGVEGATADRLLRSFVVSPSHRRGGLGTEALTLLETLLVSRGVQSLHLLTTTAAPFFLRHGFESLDRAKAPNAIQQSLEFRSLCPSTASYLAKRLP
ncbi:GNAT family N-acetyltransferase [Pseudomonas gingeri]|uniref:arsenic resistance N-acetyltransferase ArsN2 n=1 Tax=Pseudomonas gingeri TaxID=117681 RepID=UPI0015A4DBB1|nr:arsenic resistance N-acetyltransferase ArsN2 [Pseudomonas gingeri]NWA26444.1 GNAT family N-acetyltransferase [Pseudomonas gingeri]NWD67958.1 GNAT family N-acetyltransferase [Pseudomonas gingeri]